MATVRPFCAIRPRQDIAARVAALPYDVYNRAEAKAETVREPLSFLCIDRAETQLSDDVDTYDPKVYEKARSLMKKRIEDNTFVADTYSCYYIYELVMDGRSQTGIVGCASIDDYVSGGIKKHENTRADKEADRIRHVDTLSAQTGPIFLGFRDNPVIREIMERVRKEAPEYDFTSPDGVTHRAWLISSDTDIAAVRGTFDTINDIYICDGHHRCSSAERVCKMRREKNVSQTGDEPYNYFLSVLFPAEELKILDYNRVVKDLNGLSESRFLDRIRKKFDVREVGDEPFKPKKPHEFGLYISGRWYVLTAHDDIITDDPVDRLDVSILQNDLLSPILNIEDPRTDPRISFIGGIHGMKGLMEKVDSGKYACAFSLYPTDINDLFSVADSGRLMPPKSTWFEPKLRSGLFIHRI